MELCTLAASLIVVAALLVVVAAVLLREPLTLGVALLALWVWWWTTKRSARTNALESEKPLGAGSTSPASGEVP